MAKYHGTYEPDFKFDDFHDAEGHFDSDAYQKAEDAWIEKLKKGLRKLSKEDLVGEEIHWQQGDGYARYVIVRQKPLTLGHLAVGDAWTVGGETIRGFRLKDAQAQVERDRKWRAHEVAHKTATEKFYEKNLGKMVHYHDGFGQFIRCEVVRVEEDVEGFPAIKKGELCMKETELVGKWRDYDLHSDSFHVRKCGEGRLMQPNLSNVYEFSKDLQKKHADPRGMEPCVVHGQQELFGT